MSDGRRNLLGLPLDSLTEQGIVAVIDRIGDRRVGLYHASLNAAKVVAARSDEQLRRAMWQFDLVTADGQSIVWAARLLRCPVPERIAGIDLMDTLLEHAAERRWRVFLLGGKQEVLERVAAEIAAKFPGVAVAGRQHGYFARSEEARIVQRIKGAGADLLFVALGSPDKELFLDRHRSELNVRFGMGVGGAFDVIAGVRKRAPRILQRLGLEWAYRLAQEPSRLTRRYITSNVSFTVLVAKELLSQRRTPPS